MGEEPKARPSLAPDPVLELIGHFKRTFGLIRLYGLEHDTGKAGMQQLFEKLTGYLGEHGALCMVLEATAIKVDDKKVLEDDRKDESVIRPLFVDGVESITFLADLPEAEFSAYMRAWSSAVFKDLGSEYSFSTFVWEQDFQSIFTSVRPGLADTGADGEEAKAAEGRLHQLYAQMLGSSTLAKGSAMVVDVSSLAVVKHVLGDVSAEDLARTAEAAQAALPDLAKNERATLASGLVASARGAGQRALYALWQWFPQLQATPRRDTEELAGRIVIDLTREGRMTEVSRALVRIVELGQGQAELDDFLTGLCEPSVLKELVRQVEDPATSADALTLLKYLPDAFVATLGAPFAEAAPDVRHRLVPILAHKKPSGELLAGWLMSYGPRIAGSLFELADALEQDVQDLLIRAALIHDSPEVVLKGLSKIKPEWMPQFRSLVEPRLQHESNEVRRAALNAFIWAKDEIVPELLEAQLMDPSASDDVKKMCIRGLATFGGPSAAALLARILTEMRGQQLRVAAALALSSVDDPASRAALTRESSRLFGDRAVKQAARESLRRLEKRQAGVPSDPPPPAEEGGE
ncbi:MAG: HEAT repeat domain-containing protein [Myxococcota bacterium]